MRFLKSTEYPARGLLKSKWSTHSSEKGCNKPSMHIMHHANISCVATWYVIHTHRMQEERVGHNLSTLGIETLTPRYVKRRYNNYTGEVAHVIKPFFPNYVFAQFDVSKLLHKVRLTRGVHSIVCYGTTPALIDDCIIATIRSRIGEDGYVKIGENLKPGDEVIIEDGLLKDFRGIFERETSDADRVIILLQTVSYQAHLVVEREVLKKIGQLNGR
jgi:transcriptional antiterminator RfaH